MFSSFSYFFPVWLTVCRVNGEKEPAYKEIEQEIENIIDDQGIFEGEKMLDKMTCYRRKKETSDSCEFPQKWNLHKLKTKVSWEH